MTDCRACGAPLAHSFADLGLTPVSNAFVRPEDAHRGEVFLPLHALVCDRCWLVQLADFGRPEAHFHDEYAYFSSFSASWLDHARRYVAAMTTRFDLGPGSRVMEIASNDGYLLQYFVAAGIPCLGIEPTANTAAAGREKGVASRQVFFGRDSAAALAAEGWQVDLLLGNNVLAHVPDLHDFVGGMPAVLKPHGVATLEFPHLARLIADCQFDTIYHEHYSYLSLIALLPVFARAGMRVFDVETLATHGGSLRVYLCHAAAGHAETPRVADCLRDETVAGLTRLSTYLDFAGRVAGIKLDLLDYFITARRAGRRVAGYGAAAKGNTLLNFCGIGRDFVDFVVDRNPAKQGRLLPGSRIPVLAPEAVAERRPDDLFILPWNLKDEIIGQMAHIRAWGGRFVVPVPTVTVLP